MPITYRQHLDSRDGTIYNCVLMPDGKWWSAENLAFVGYGSGGYYIHEDAQSALPPGTHGPLQAEWLAMISASGGGLGLKTTTGWGGGGGLDTYGFALAPTGYLNERLMGTEGSCHIVFPHTPGAERGYINATPYSQSVRYRYSSSDQVYGYKIRFIVDVFNEPHPTKLFGVNFDGFERGMTVSIQRPIQVIDSIGGSVKLIPYGPAELDEWRVETELWVKGEWAAELEAAVPPYGVPQTTDMYLPPRSGSASFPGLRPALASSNADKYIHPQVTRFESQGRKGPIVDLFGYFMDFTLRAWADGQATNQASTPTTTLPTWLAQKFAARQIQDWSVQTATVSSGGFRSTYLRSKHGRRKDVNFNLDHLTAAQANELVAFFRGVRHNVTTITCDNGPDGLQAVSVYLVGLKLHRTGLHWDGTLETVLA